MRKAALRRRHPRNQAVVGSSNVGDGDLLLVDDGQLARVGSGSGSGSGRAFKPKRVPEDAGLVMDEELAVSLPAWARK